MISTTSSTSSTITTTTTLKTLATFCLNKRLDLTIVQGTVVDFTTTNNNKAAIVNAANEGCLGGRGVDGAITLAGGENLARDRRVALENIGMGHFRMNAQHHADFLHGRQNRKQILPIRNSKIRIGHRSRWIILACNNGGRHAIIVFQFRSLVDFVCRCLVRQVEGH
jgi:hypothetical protein